MKRKHDEDIVFCVNVTRGGKPILKNRLYGYNPEWSWMDVIQDLSDEFDKPLKKTDTFEISISSKIQGSEVFYPDLNESIQTVTLFDKSLKYASFNITEFQSENTCKERDTHSSTTSTNAFNIMMENSKLCQRKPSLKSNEGPRFTAKDRLYNDLVTEMVVKKALFPNAMEDRNITKQVNVVVDALWYVDGSFQKLSSRCDKHIFPKRLLALYSDYNDWKKHRKRAPQLTVHGLKQHSSSLFSILMLPFSSSWGDFATDLKNLALCFDDYAAFLEKSNNEQQERQLMNQPIREVATHAYLQHRSAVTDVKAKYSLLEAAVSKLDFYESLYFDEERHVINGTFKNTFERFDFIENIALSEPIDILRYNPGGSIGATVFVWRLPKNRGLNEVMNDTLHVVEKLKSSLPEFHTRRMRREFVKRYSNLNSVSVPKHVLRAIYAELTLDASAGQNPTIDARIQQAILSDDPDLVIDMRHNNKGRPDNTFQPFFDLLAAKIEEISAADERRHNIEHLSKYISVRDLINDVKKDMPDSEDTKIPSESTVLFSFAPKNAYLNSARLYKSTIPLQFKVQTRQLRASHQDDHFCAAQYKYMRQFAHKFKDNMTFLSIDDKSKVDFGEPGQYTASGVRGKKSLVPSNSNLSALDHDVGNKGSITPSVCLNIEIPEEKDGSFYQGTVHVTYKDSIFQPSSPWRHVAELQNILQDDVGTRGTIKPFMIIFSDGGPDHRITYNSVKLSLIMMFKNLDLDLLIAGRTAPGHSWLNPVERIMSILNIALQNIALSRSECNADIEQSLRSANSMAEIRKKAEKVADLKPAWITSLSPMVDLLRSRTEKLILKGVPFKTHDAAPEELIQALEGQIQREIDPTISSGKYQQKDLKSKIGYQGFLKDHCLERQYVFQIRKCAKPECCRPKRGPDVPWLPDPVLSNDVNHYKPFDDVLGQVTSDNDRPSAKNTTVAAVAEELQGVKNNILTGQNVRKLINCVECLKPRCVYSKKSLTLRESRTFTRLLERYDYTCGALITPEGDILHGKLFVRLQLCCSSPIEYAYYATTTIAVRKDICCHCASVDAQRDPNLLTHYRVVLPMCETCKESKKEPLKRNPIKN